MEERINIKENDGIFSNQYIQSKKNVKDVKNRDDIH